MMRKKQKTDAQTMREASVYSGGSCRNSSQKDKLAASLQKRVEKGKMTEENMSFTYYGRQRIERRTSVLMRELVTEGFVKRVPRTENNPHGLLIVNWRTILNKDIEQRKKSNY